MYLYAQRYQVSKYLFAEDQNIQDSIIFAIERRSKIKNVTLGYDIDGNRYT